MRGFPMGDGLIAMKPVELETVTELFPAWISDPDVRRFLGIYHHIPDRKQEEKWYQRVVENDAHYVWQIEYAGHAVGISGIHRIDFLNGRATTGTIIGEKAVWRQGIGTKTMIMRARFAFDELSLYALESMAFVDNTGSVRALSHCGYEQKSVFEGYYFRRGQRWDVAFFYLTAEQFRQLHPRSD